MFKNYLISSLRALIKNKLHTTINIIGLSLALGICILIFQYLLVEVSFDSFHSNKDRIYRITSYEKWESGFAVDSPVSSFVMGNTLAENYGNQIEIVQFLTQNAMVRNSEGENFVQSIALGSSNFFEVFDFTLEGPETGNALQNPNSVVISHDMAIKYYGRKDVIGETMEIRIGDRFESYTITGMFPEIPFNSSLRFQVLVPIQNARKALPEREFENWFFALIENYVLLDPGMSPEVMQDKFNATITSIIGQDNKEVEFKIGLQPLSDIHLNTDYRGGIAQVADPSLLFILGGIALLILAIACINFTTMAIGNAAARAHEVGIRKSIGAAKSQLVSQYMTEAFVLTLISVVIGILISEIGLNYFNRLFNSGISIDFSIQILLIVLVLLVLVGFSAGFYPSLVISALNPVKTLKGQLRLSGKSRLRKSLVSLQFIMSLMLISSTLIMQKQMDYLENMDPGFRKDLLVTADLNSPNVPGLLALADTGFYKASVLKTELQKYPSIKMGTTQQSVGTGSWIQLGYEDEGRNTNFKFNLVDEGYIPTMDIKLIMGENFRAGNNAFNDRSIIVNEAFVREFNMEDPIGKTIPGGRFEDIQIIGVVEDFNFESLHREVRPLVLATDGREIFRQIDNVGLDTDPSPNLVFSLQPSGFEKDLEKIAEVWEATFPGERFEYVFVDEQLARQYRAEKNLSKMITSAALIAIFIAILGLFALTMLILTGKSKEIGIRKVLGASVRSITFMLTREFLLLLLVSLIISIPISYYLMNEWLSRFEFQTHVGPVVFLLTGIIGLLFTLITVASQALKASMQNPVNAIREE